VSTVTARSCPTCGAIVVKARARYCSAGCRAKAWRTAHASIVVEQTVHVPGYAERIIPASIVKLLAGQNSKSGRLQRALLVAISEHRESGAIPTSGRFLYYELEQRGVVAKDNTTSVWAGVPARSRSWAQEISAALLALRKAGVVDWDEIVDETRHLDSWRSASSVAESLIEHARTARIHCWGAEPAPLVICESRSLVGVLRPLAFEYLCPITATNGQAGGFIVTDIVPVLNGNDRRVIYLGDEDHHGHLIEANTRRYVEDYTARTFTAETWQRIAITLEQIADLDLAPMYDDEGRAKYETEALGQSRIQQILRDHLAELLPEPLAAVRERQQRQRDRAVAALTGAGIGERS
jgi:hypothetical protein